MTIRTKVVCFCHLLKCLRSLFDRQSGTTPEEQSYLGPHFLSLYLNLSNDVCKNMQQTTEADSIFEGILRVNFFPCYQDMFFALALGI